MMAAILNSAIMILVLLDSAILGFPLKLTLAKIDSHHLHIKKLHSFILTQLDDGSHLEFSHLGFRHLVHQKNSHSFILTQNLTDGTPLLDSAILHNKFNLTQTHSFSLNLMMAAILNSAILDSGTLLSSLRFTQKWTLTPLWLCLKLIHSHFTWWWQPSWIQPFCTKKMSLIHSPLTWWWQPSWTLPSWIQTLCHLGFRHLVIFSQIHSKTLSLHSVSDSI